MKKSLYYLIPANNSAYDFSSAEGWAMDSDLAIHCLNQGMLQLENGNFQAADGSEWEIAERPTWTPATMGRKGGRVSSPAKAKAARENARKHRKPYEELSRTGKAKRRALEEKS